MSFIKRGSPMPEDENSGKILTQVQVSQDTGKIVKEAKIEKKIEDEKSCKE